MGDIKAKVDRLNSLHIEVHAYKFEHRDERIGYYPGSVASVLNAYREGDLTFDEARAELFPAALAKELREAIADLEVDGRSAPHIINGFLSCQSDALTAFDAVLKQYGIEIKEK